MGQVGKHLLAWVAHYGLRMRGIFYVATIVAVPRCRGYLMFGFNPTSTIPASVPPSPLRLFYVTLYEFFASFRHGLPHARFTQGSGVASPLSPASRGPHRSHPICEYTSGEYLAAPAAHQRGPCRGGRGRSPPCTAASCNSKE